MKPSYRQWLEQQKYDAGTINTQIARCKRVQEYYGDLDEGYADDHLASLIETLRYTKADQRNNRLNPSKIPIDGDIHNNLASYRASVQLYRRFREAIRDLPDAGVPIDEGGIRLPEEPLNQWISLERDMQAGLRLDISQLEQGLTIIDDGSERSVDSGLIDITARDAAGATVVIELKAGPVGQRAVAQILTYMGDLISEEEYARVRGILVASSFDAKAKAAAKAVPTLALRKYSVRFLFSDGNA